MEQQMEMNPFFIRGVSEFKAYVDFCFQNITKLPGVPLRFLDCVDSVDFQKVFMRKRV